MEDALNDLSASHLRTVLLKEIRLFIDCLDSGSAEELQARKDRVKNILALLTDKELVEMAPLNRGGNGDRLPTH